MFCTPTSGLAGLPSAVTYSLNKVCLSLPHAQARDSLTYLVVIPCGIYVLKSPFDFFQVAVIVNDMAEVNIDAELVRGHEVQLVQEQLVELSNGCICCTLRDDLLKVMSHLMLAHAKTAMPCAQPACIVSFLQAHNIDMSVTNILNKLIFRLQAVTAIHEISLQLEHLRAGFDTEFATHCAAGNHASHPVPAVHVCLQRDKWTSLQEVAEMASAGRFDYLVIESTGMSIAVHKTRLLMPSSHLN